MLQSQIALHIDNIDMLDCMHAPADSAPRTRSLLMSWSTPNVAS